MPTSPDVLDWRTVVEVIGTGAAILIVSFQRSYSTARSRERDRAEASPEVAARAVGAAIVDRTTADVATRMAGHVEEIRDVVVGWEDRRQDDIRDELAELRRIAREKGGPS